MRIFVSLTKPITYKPHYIGSLSKVILDVVVLVCNALKDVAASSWVYKVRIGVRHVAENWNESIAIDDCIQTLAPHF